MKVFLPTLLFILFVGCINSNAQTDEERHFNTWWSLKVKTDINDRLYVNSQVSLRRYDILKSWQKIILRTRALYRINDLCVAGIGYTYSRNFQADQPNRFVAVPRSDIFTEFGFTNRFDKLRLINRFRLEHRFTGVMVVPEDENLDTYIGGTSFSNRIRYRMTFKHPILEEIFNSKFYAAGFYELFLSMSNKFKFENINSNVFKFVVGCSLKRSSTLELGFRRQIKLKRSYTLKEINTVLDVAIKYRFDIKDVAQKKLLRYLSSNE
jgi:hypothetical protein